MRMKKKVKNLARFLCRNYASDGLCCTGEKCDYNCYSGRVAKDLDTAGYRLVGEHEIVIPMKKYLRVLADRRKYKEAIETTQLKTVDSILVLFDSCIADMNELIESAEKDAVDALDADIGRSVGLAQLEVINFLRNKVAETYNKKEDK